LATGRCIIVWLLIFVFEEAFNKTTSRARNIGSMHASTLHNVKAYNRDAITTSSYIAQLRLFPNSFVDKQDGIVSSILKIPCRAFGKTLPFSHELLHPHLVELRTVNLAALSRASWATVSWQLPALALLWDFLELSSAAQLGDKAKHDCTLVDRIGARNEKKKLRLADFPCNIDIPTTIGVTRVLRIGCPSLLQFCSLVLTPFFRAISALAITS
jgi:hypothetical protein